MPTAVLVETTVEEWIKNLHQSSLSRQYFPAEAKITVDHVRSVFGQETLNKSPEWLEALVTKVEQTREEARDWGTHKVGSRICLHMQEQGYGHVAVFKELLRTWKKSDGGLSITSAVWNAVYGRFDMEPEWALRMEDEYFRMKGFQYPDDRSRLKGCFERLFHSCKNNLIKRINRHGKSTHNTTIRMKPTCSEITPSTRFKKRIKGDTLGGFATIEGKTMHGVKEALDDQTKAETKPDEQTKTAKSIELEIEEVDDTTELEIEEVDTEVEAAKTSETTESEDSEVEFASPIVTKKKKSTIDDETSKLKKKLRELQEQLKKQNKVISSAKEKAMEEKREAEKQRCEEIVQKQNRRRVPNKRKTKAPKKKDTASPVEDNSEPASDELVPESIMNHRMGENKEMEVLVNYGAKLEWEKLYDIWADFPDIVVAYRRSEKLKLKCFQTPTIDKAKYIARVIGHTGAVSRPKQMTFCVIFDNGFREDNVSYANAMADAKEKVEVYIFLVKSGL